MADSTRSHGRFQCLDILACVLQTLTLTTVYERTLRTYMQVSTNWHLQVHLSLEQSQWGREFKTAGNNAAIHIEFQHCRLKLPLEVEDSVNTVLELMLCFSANQQTCMAGIEYLWTALTRGRAEDRRVHGRVWEVFTDSQTRSVLSVAMRTLRLHGYQRTPWDRRPSLFQVQHDAEMEGDGARINACLAIVVLLVQVHSAGWESIMDANSHAGPGEFPELCPDLEILAPVLLHFYKDMSLTIWPADGSPPQFRDHLESLWGHIQLKGADAFQRLLETLDRASLRTLLGGLGNRNWHRLGTQWSDIRMKCSIRGQCSFGYRKEEAMTTAIATLLEKNSFSEDDFLVHGDSMYQWIAELTQFRGTDGTRYCTLPLGHGCRALSNILTSPQCEDFVSADCRLNIITAIVEGLEYMPEWGANDLEDVGQTILHCCMGVPTLPFQRALVAAIHALWETRERTVAWTVRWTQWLASLLDKGLWTTALVVECNGIEELVAMHAHRLGQAAATPGGAFGCHALLGQKDAMAIPESVPLSAVDEDNRLTILARVPPRQEGAPDDHA